jgi:hypothetical protein
VRRVHGLFFSAHSRSASDSNAFTPPTRRDSITTHTIPLGTANARPLSAISNASTVSSTIPFPDFDSSFEPPREEDENDTGESDHGSQEAEDGEDEDGDEVRESDTSSENDAPLRRPLFNTQELAEMSAFYGVPVTGKGRLSFDFGSSDDESSADESGVLVQEAREKWTAWRSGFSRSTNSTPSRFRKSILGSVRSGLTGQTGTSSHRNRLSVKFGQGMRNSIIGSPPKRTDGSTLQHRFPALLNPDAEDPYSRPASEHSDASESSDVSAPSVTSSMYRRRFEHILGPGIRDSWMSGLFTANFGQWNKNEKGEEEEPEPIPEPSPYPEFDEETGAKVASFLKTMGRDTQLINRRLKRVLAEWKWVGITDLHGLVYIRKPDTLYDEVVFIYNKLGQYMEDLREQLSAIKGVDIGFDNTLRSWLIDEREPKDIVPVVEMYERKYKAMMEELAAKKAPIMQEVVEEKKLMLPKVAELKRMVEEELIKRKEVFMKTTAQKVAEKKTLTEQEVAEQKIILRLEYGAQWYGDMMCQIRDELVAESVADTESEYDPWPSSEEDVTEEIQEEDEDDLDETESHISQGEKWGDLDDYQSTDNGGDRVERTEEESGEGDGSENSDYDDNDEIVVSGYDDNDEIVVSGYDDNDEIVVSGYDDNDEIVVSGYDNDGENVVSGYDSDEEEEEETNTIDSYDSEFTSEQWMSGVLEAERTGIMFDPYRMTVQESQEIVLQILRARLDDASTLDSNQIGEERVKRTVSAPRTA